MRTVLVDSARARRYQKRGGGWGRVTFDEALTVTERGPDLEALDDAIEALAKKDDRKARVVELRIFGGLTNEEIAVALDISTDTSPATGRWRGCGFGEPSGGVDALSD